MWLARCRVVLGVRCSGRACCLVAVRRAVALSSFLHLWLSGRDRTAHWPDERDQNEDEERTTRFDHTVSLL